MACEDTRATLRYLVPTGAKPVYFASRGGADAALNIGAEFEDREVGIIDARCVDPAPELDREGFQLVRHDSGVTDFYRLESQRERYEQSLVELVCTVTGAADAQVFDHTLRSDSPDVRGAHTSREPAAVIHNDYTDASAERRLRDLVPDLLSDKEAQRRLQRRYAIVNVWRSIAGPVLRSPLTLCDARTIDDSDLVASERRAAERIGELQLVCFNSAHRWLYYPAMTAGEALLIKTFDAARDGRARRSIHAAFDNPLAPADAPPRESLESRLLVFY